MRVVLDANVLVSAVISTAGPSPAQPGLSPDPDDDYLITLAHAAGADYLVSGDRHLLDLADAKPPVLTPRRFLDLVGA